MKALSIRQPWAWLICAGYKNIENRDWPTKFRGRIYVYTGKTMDVNVPGKSLTEQWILERLNYEQQKEYQSAPKYRGSIIGEVDIIGCVSQEDAFDVSGKPEELRFNAENYAGKPGFGNLVYTSWFVGKYGFLLANPKLYEAPVPYKGQLGFFEVKLEAK